LHVWTVFSSFSMSIRHISSRSGHRSKPAIMAKVLVDA
jgi:hypothetical protein